MLAVPKLILVPRLTLATELTPSPACGGRLGWGRDGTRVFWSLGFFECELMNDT